MKKQIKNAIIYARQSSGNDDQSNSIDAQVANCIALCKARGYRVKLICKDLNISGRTYPLCGENVANIDLAFQSWYEEQTKTKKFRPQLDMVLSMLNPGDVLVVEDLTRLYRGLKNGYLSVFIKQQLLQLRVTVETVKSGNFDPNSFNDDLIENIQSHVNDQQIQMGKLKSMEVRRRMKNNGILCTGVRVVGLKYLGDHQYKVKDEYREAIRYVFDSVIAQLSYSQIQRDMNNKYKHLFGKCFYESNFYHITSQPLYAGYMRNTESEIIKCKGLVGDAVITKEQWIKVQEIMSKKRTTPIRGVRGTTVLPFSQKCICGCCQSSMVIVRDKMSEAYFCKAGSNLIGNQSCSNSRTRINETISKNYTGLKHALSPLLVLAQYQICLEQAGSKKHKEKYNTLKTKLRLMRSRMQHLTDSYLCGEMDSIIYDNTKIKFNKNIKIIETELIEIQQQLTINYKKIMLADEFWGMFDAIMENKIPDGKYKELLDRVVDKIICYKDYVTVVTKFGQFDLDRYITKKSRSFPLYSWILLEDNTETPKDISKCKLEIVYHYHDQREKKVKIDFPVLKIYENH